MYSVKVNLKDNAYDIMIGQKCLDGLGTALKPLALGPDAVVITNPVVKRLHGKTLIKGLKGAGFSVKVFEVPDGEKSKSFRQAFRLIQDIAAYDVGRQVFVVAFGGGVIGDLAGYVAAAYKRGVPFVQVPTTFLAQVDSSIGGKVAVDLPVGKNLVGAFYQPRLVYSDVSLLSTLSPRQMRNGLSEAVKYGIICDRPLFNFIEQKASKLLARDPNALREVVHGCSAIKARVVASDEKETKGLRTILNFGHTVGHAIEAASSFKGYCHGEAVAVGMRIAAHISRQLKLTAKDNVARVNEVISALGLPEKAAKVSLSAILKYMKHDKKFKGKTNRFVLMTGIGSVKVVEGVSETVIRKAVQAHLK